MLLPSIIIDNERQIGTILSENTSEIILRNWFEKLLWSGAIFYHISRRHIFLKKNQDQKCQTQNFMISILYKVWAYVSYSVTLLIYSISELLYHQPPRLVGVRALAVSQPAGPASRATALFGLFAKKLLCKMKKRAVSLITQPPRVTFEIEKFWLKSHLDFSEKSVILMRESQRKLMPDWYQSF